LSGRRKSSPRLADDPNSGSGSAALRAPLYVWGRVLNPPLIFWPSLYAISTHFGTFVLFFWSCVPFAGAERADSRRISTASRPEAARIDAERLRRELVEYPHEIGCGRLAMRNTANIKDLAGWVEFFPAAGEAEALRNPPARSVRWSGARAE
jgi:hypothetical protein